jgi:glutathione S-transferase
MALKIYGSPQSRTLRVLWMAAELGLEPELIPLAWDDPALKAPGFLAINPAGRVPVIDDDGFRLSESLAICLYLAKKAGSPLYPATLEGEAATWSWTLWAMFDLEAPLDNMRRHSLLLSEPEREPAVIAEALRRVGPALELLEGTLQGRRWLAGEAFGMADFNVACVLSPSRTAMLDLGRHPAVGDWLERCRSRPACVEARRMLDEKAPLPREGGGAGEEARKKKARKAGRRRGRGRVGPCGRGRRGRPGGPEG